MTGAYAVEALLEDVNYGKGISRRHVRQPDYTKPLMECIERTRAVAAAIAARNFETAMDLRGSSFRRALEFCAHWCGHCPNDPPPGQKPLRLAVMNAGAPAPGMNMAVRTAVRLGVDKGHTMTVSIMAFGPG